MRTMQVRSDRTSSPRSRKTTSRLYQHTREIYWEKPHKSQENIGLRTIITDGCSLYTRPIATRLDTGRVATVSEFISHKLVAVKWLKGTPDSEKFGDSV